MESFLSAVVLLHCLHTVFVLPLTVVWTLRELVFMGPDSLPSPRRMVVVVHWVWALSPMLGALLAAATSVIGVREWGVRDEFVYILIYTLLLVPISASWLWSLRRSSPFDEASVDKVRAALFGVSLWAVCVLGVALFHWANALTGY